jgi:hypothetical protein
MISFTLAMAVGVMVIGGALRGLVSTFGLVVVVVAISSPLVGVTGDYSKPCRSF